VYKNSELEKLQTCVEDWIFQFARIFKSDVAFDCDSYLDLHEIGMKLYSQALEDTATSESVLGQIKSKSAKTVNWKKCQPVLRTGFSVCKDI
jgi:hypothetical protein